MYVNQTSFTTYSTSRSKREVHERFVRTDSVRLISDAFPDGHTNDTGTFGDADAWTDSETDNTGTETRSDTPAYAWSVGGPDPCSNANTDDDSRAMRRRRDVHR